MRHCSNDLRSSYEWTRPANLLYPPISMIRPGIDGSRRAVNFATTCYYSTTFPFFTIDWIKPISMIRQHIDSSRRAANSPRIDSWPRWESRNEINCFKVPRRESRSEIDFQHKPILECTAMKKHQRLQRIRITQTCMEQRASETLCKLN